VLLNQLEERVQKTKMGMAAMVETLLVQALQQQEISEAESVQGDRLDRLEKRIEVLESKFTAGSDDSQEVEVSASVEILPLSSSTVESNGDQSEGLDTSSDEEISSRIALEVRPVKHKKDKTILKYQILKR